MIRVLVVHETRLLRSALTALLRDAEGIDAVAACWRTAPGRARSFRRPQVCVVDVDCAGSVSSADHPGGPERTHRRQANGSDATPSSSEACKI